MALKSTIYKVKLSVANLNIHHYEDYNLTIAKHPSETNLRLMYRLLAFCLLCQEAPEFTKGLSSDAEPDLWKINYDGGIDHWIELGMPDERRIRQICSKAKQVSLFTYHGATSLSWFSAIEGPIQRFSHLNVTHLKGMDGQDIETLVERGMNFNVTIEDDEIWVASDQARMHFNFNTVFKAKGK